MDADRQDSDLAVEDSSGDDSHRRAFKQPRPRRRRRAPRAATGHGVDLWGMRDGLGYGLTRALCAIGFGLVPGVSERFGDAGLALVAAGLALTMVLIVVALVRMGQLMEWRMLADAVTLLVLTPVLVTASGIEVADARLGGRSANFLAAAAATILIYAIVVIVATRAGTDRTVASQIGALPGALSITAVLLGTNHFSAGALWKGLAVSWMAAATITVLAMLVSLRARVAVAPMTFALFALGIVLLQSRSGDAGALSSESSSIAMGAVAFVAVILIFIPLPRRRSRARHQNPDWISPATDRPFNS